MTGAPDLDIAAAKAAVEALVNKFDGVVKSGKKRRYHEPRTVNEFIQPLFLALGWDVHNALGEDDVLPEDAVSRKRVDWAFRIRGVPRFFLEAKSVNENLDDPRWARQAINYAYNKSVTWAVLTNFERLRIYNAEWLGVNPNQNLFIELGYTEFVDQFDRLALLSRPAMVERALDELADSVHKKLKKTPVGDRLFGDLLTFRAMLRDYLRAYNGGPNADVAAIEQAVQRLLDRLIFIRTIEDRMIEPNQLRSLVRDLEARGKKGALWKELLKLFRNFDVGYDSQLFADQTLDGLETEVEPIRVTIEGLYGARDGSIEYDFSAIDADVLGGVYEQYLGQLAKSPPVIKSKLSVAEALARTAKADTKPYRKAHGVYYTPRWVTRYIVNETLGALITQRTPDEVRQIRVLDPACGSGSFLIEAFRVLDAYWAKQEPTTDETVIRDRRTRILRDNIFGIDLDPQAVEIAHLNLLLVATDRRELLPDLTKNIVVANALFERGRVPSDVSGSTPSVDWSVLGSGGTFDAVVGNPPYIRAEGMSRTDRDYFMSGAGFHPVGRFDIYVLFVELALQRLAPGGRTGLIVPAALAAQNYGEWLRRELLDSRSIEALVDLRHIDVFHGVAVHPMIIVAGTQGPTTDVPMVRPRHEGEVADQSTWERWTLPATLFRQMPKAAFRLGFRPTLTGPVAAFEKFGTRLGDIAYCITGFVAHDSATGASKDRLITDDPFAPNVKPYLEAKEVGQPFATLTPQRFIRYEPDQMHRPKFPQLFDRPKLLIHRVTGTSGRLRVSVDRAAIYVNHSFDCVVRFCDLTDAPTYARGSAAAVAASESVSLDALAALLNSSHMWGYFRVKHGTDMDATPASLRALPLPPLERLAPGSDLDCLGLAMLGAAEVKRESLMNQINAAVLDAYEIKPDG